MGEHDPMTAVVTAPRVTYRVDGDVPTNLYRNDDPIGQTCDPKDAQLIVDTLNGSYRELCSQIVISQNLARRINALEDERDLLVRGLRELCRVAEATGRPLLPGQVLQLLGADPGHQTQ